MVASQQTKQHPDLSVGLAQLTEGTLDPMVRANRAIAYIATFIEQYPELKDEVVHELLSLCVRTSLGVDRSLTVPSGKFEVNALDCVVATLSEIMDDVFNLVVHGYGTLTITFVDHWPKFISAAPTRRVTERNSFRRHRKLIKGH